MARILFVGAYCSNYFNWCDADFDLRPKSIKCNNSKVPLKGPSNLVTQIVCDWHISLQTDIPVLEGMRNLGLTNRHFSCQWHFSNGSLSPPVTALFTGIVESLLFTGRTALCEQIPWCQKKFSASADSTLIVRSTATDQSLKVWTQEILLWNSWKEAKHSRDIIHHFISKAEDRQCMCVLQVIISQKCTEFERATDTCWCDLPHSSWKIGDSEAEVFLPP